MSEKRQFLRTKFDSRVKLEHPEHGTGIFRTGDVSDGGIFLQCGPFDLAIGDRVTVQIQDVPIEAPLVRMMVVRMHPEGCGLRFDD
jgi:PilZ domain